MSSKCSGSGASIKVGDRRDGNSKYYLSESRSYIDIEDDGDVSCTSSILMIFFFSIVNLGHLIRGRSLGFNQHLLLIEFP